MATVKGIYTFKDTLTPITFGSQDVNFASKTYGIEISCVSILDSTMLGSNTALGYMPLENDYEYPVYFYVDSVGPGKIGWEFESAKIVDFGGTPQTVSDEFYNWLLENTEPQNTQIYISTNGRTILATAGKYCDRNIDVSVNVPSNDAELEEQKAITDSILDRSITEYVNDTATNIGLYAFSHCRSLTKIQCGNLLGLKNYCLQECTALKEARFSRKNSSENGSIGKRAFYNCSALEKLILDSAFIYNLQNVDAFTGTPIASGTGYIYVPNDLEDDYKANTNWSSFANQIKPISELGE